MNYICDSIHVLTTPTPTTSEDHGVMSLKSETKRSGVRFFRRDPFKPLTAKLQAFPLRRRLAQRSSPTDHSTAFLTTAMNEVNVRHGHK